MFTVKFSQREHWSAADFFDTTLAEANLMSGTVERHFLVIIRGWIEGAGRGLARPFARIFSCAQFSGANRRDRLLERRHSTAERALDDAEIKIAAIILKRIFSFVEFGVLYGMRQSLRHRIKTISNFINKCSAPRPTTACLSSMLIAKGRDEAGKLEAYPISKNFIHEKSRSALFNVNTIKNKIPLSQIILVNLRSIFQGGFTKITMSFLATSRAAPSAEYVSTSPSTSRVWILGS